MACSFLNIIEGRWGFRFSEVNGAVKNSLENVFLVGLCGAIPDGSFKDGKPFIKIKYTIRYYAPEGYHFLLPDNEK